MITVSVSYVHESLQSFRLQSLQSITMKNLQLKLHFTSSSESLPVITVCVCVCVQHFSPVVLYVWVGPVQRVTR